MEIFHAYQKRTLEAAVRFYLARDHTGAHTVAADVSATAEILDAMLDRYTDLPRDVAGLHRQFGLAGGVDSDNFFTKVEGEIRFAKGKHRGDPGGSGAARGRPGRQELHRRTRLRRKARRCWPRWPRRMASSASGGHCPGRQLGKKRRRRRAFRRPRNSTPPPRRPRCPNWRSRSRKRTPRFVKPPSRRSCTSS